jgi:hypothetical protein
MIVISKPASTGLVLAGFKKSWLEMMIEMTPPSFTPVSWMTFYRWSFIVMDLDYSLTWQSLD